MGSQVSVFAGLVANARAGRLRVAFHVHDADADLAAECLAGHLDG